MKHAVVAFLGLVIGAAAAGALLYYNPLAEHDAPPPSPGDRLLRYTLPDDLLALSFGEHALLPAPTPDGGTLWEETIDRTALLGLTLDDAANQPAAVASRFLGGAKQTDLLLEGVVLDDQWLVTVPGEGTLFVEARTNVWPFLKGTLLPVWYFDRPWRGPADFRATAGPGADDRAVLIGATGAFLGRSGSAVEDYRLTELDPERRTAAAVAELRLHLPEPAPEEVP